MTRSTRRPRTGLPTRRSRTALRLTATLVSALTILASLATPAAAQFSRSLFSTASRTASSDISSLLKESKTTTTRMASSDFSALYDESTRRKTPTAPTSGSTTLTTMPDEWAVGCPIPTLEQCMEPHYLEGRLPGHERCGALQGDNDWTCFHVLQEQAGQYEAGPGIFDEDLEASGVVAKSHKVPADNNDSHTHFEGEIGSPVNVTYGDTLFTQGKGKNWLTYVDRQLAWSSGPNRTRFHSCEEYAYERYYEVTNFWREVGHDRHDYLRTFETAFGPGSSDAALGTNNYWRDFFADIHGEPVLPASREVYRNRFLELPGAWNPHIFTSQPGTSSSNGPSLLDALRGYSDESAAIVAAIEAVEEPTIVKDMAFYEKAFDNLTFEGAPQLGLQQRVSEPSSNSGISIDGQLVSEPVTPDPIDITGQVPLDYSRGKTMRRMFAQEQNELYALQEELGELFREWDRINALFENSGWDITDLLDEFEIDDLKSISDGRPPGGYQTAIPKVFELKTDNGTAKIGGIQAELLPETPTVPLSPENEARKRVLDALVDIYTQAIEAECIADFPTHCDFSVQEFAENAVTHAVDEQQEAYEMCLELMPDPFEDNLGTSRRVINPQDDTSHIDLAKAFTVDPNLVHDFEDLLLQQCWVFIPQHPTGRDLREIAADTEVCQAGIPAYRADLADFIAKAEAAEEQAEAEARLAEHPDFVDPDTGEIRSPGISSSWDEHKGSKYFGMGMRYSYAFEADIGEDACEVGLTAGGDFYADVDVLTYKHVLVDVAAWVKTQEEAVDIHADVLGRSLFTGIKRNGLEDGEKIDFTFARKDHSRKESVAKVETTFMAGPVPLSIEVGAGGRLGFRFSMNGEFIAASGNANTISTCPSLTIEGVAEPYADAYAYASLAVDVFIAKAGVEANLLLIGISIPVKVGAGAQAYAIDEAPGIDVGVGVDMSVEARFTTLSGKVLVFCELGFCPAFCKRFEKAMVKWDGFSFDKELFSRSFTVRASDMRKAKL